MNRLEELRGDEESSGNVPSVLFIEEGNYMYRGEGKYITMKKPLSMYGAGCGLTTLVGVGLYITGNKSDGIVEIQDLTIKGGEGRGLWICPVKRRLINGTAANTAPSPACTKNEQAMAVTTAKANGHSPVISDIAK